MYKEDLALNNLQCLICHKTKLNQTENHERHVTSRHVTFDVLLSNFFHLSSIPFAKQRLSTDKNDFYDSS